MPWRRIPALLLLAAGAVAAVEDPPGTWSHYGHSLLAGGLGGAAGLGFGLLSTVNGDRESMAGAMAVGTLCGYLVGTAYGANTVTGWHEANGSFGLDLLGAVGAGVATILVGEAVASRSGSETADDARGWSALAVWGTVPLGAVLAQRLVAGRPPEVTVWHPRGASPGTVGVVARWAFR